MMLVYVVAACVWFGSGWASALTLKDDNSTFIKENFHPALGFTTKGATWESYEKFIQALRDRLLNNYETLYGIPVLRGRFDEPTEKGYLYVQLSNVQGQSVNLMLDLLDASVIGYVGGIHVNLLHPGRLKDFEAINHLFRDIDIRRPLRTFTLGMHDLPVSIKDVKLGIRSLDEAISTVYESEWHPATVTDHKMAISFAVFAEMVTHAVRFPYMKREMSRRIRRNVEVVAESKYVSFVLQWSALSSVIQQSNQGILGKPFQLYNSRYERVYVDNVNKITGLIGFLVRECDAMPYLTFDRWYHGSLICPNPELTVRISGPNGLCVDLEDENSRDGNLVQLSTCKSNNDTNQLWTLQRDGTVRSNGKCLTAKAFKPGGDVVLYDCKEVDFDAVLWQWHVWDSGTIRHLMSGLVLTATKMTAGNKLTLETNIYATNQAWLLGNITEPLVVSIAGVYDMCLQANGGEVQLEECASKKAEQLWALYADGSIRPNSVRKRCLTCANGPGFGIRVISCRPDGSSGQRWMLRNDGTITNLGNGMVLDMKESDAKLQKLIVSHSIHGLASQKWISF